MQLQDYINQVEILVHDQSNLDYTAAELIGFINNARTRVALDFGCVRQYFKGLTTVINQETYPITGGVGGALVTAGGTYAAPPTVTFDAPPAGGVQATANPVMTGTAPNLTVSSIAMTQWGQGYSSVPNVTFTPAGAAATAVALLNVIDFHSISYIFGPPQRVMLQWKPFVYFNAIFRSIALSAGPPAVWSNYTEQNTFYFYPALPDQNYPLEIDAFVLPNSLVNLTDNDTQINPPMNDCVQFYAAHLALLKAQNFEQAGYYEKKYDKRKIEVANTRNAVRRLNVYQNVWRRLQRGY